METVFMVAGVVPESWAERMTHKVLGRNPRREIGRMCGDEDLDATFRLPRRDFLCDRLLRLGKQEVEHQHLQLRVKVRLRLLDEEER